MDDGKRRWKLPYSILGIYRDNGQESGSYCIYDSFERPGYWTT